MGYRRAQRTLSYPQPSTPWVIVSPSNITVVTSTHQGAKTDKVPSLHTGPIFPYNQCFFFRFELLANWTCQNSQILLSNRIEPSKIGTKPKDPWALYDTGWPVTVGVRCVSRLFLFASLLVTVTYGYHDCVRIIFSFFEQSYCANGVRVPLMQAQLGECSTKVARHQR